MFQTTNQIGLVLLGKSPETNGLFTIQIMGGSCDLSNQSNERWKLRCLMGWSSWRWRTQVCEVENTWKCEVLNSLKLKRCKTVGWATLCSNKTHTIDRNDPAWIRLWYVSSNKVCSKHLWRCQRSTLCAKSSSIPWGAKRSNKHRENQQQARSDKTLW